MKGERGKEHFSSVPPRKNVLSVYKLGIVGIGEARPWRERSPGERQTWAKKNKKQSTRTKMPAVLLLREDRGLSSMMTEDPYKRWAS